MRSPFGQRVGGEDRGDGDGLVEIVGDDETVLCEHRVIGGGPAGHAGGMRRRGALAGTGAADFGYDDRLAGFRRAAGGDEELVDVADALDEQQDHVGGGILHHIVEEFAGAEVGFIAGADDVAERHAQRLGAVIDRKADAAALRDNADPPFGRDQWRRVRLDIDGRAEGGGDALDLAVKAFRIGTGNPHAALFRQRHDGVLHGGAVAALLGESRRDDHRVLDAHGGALLERAEHRARRDDDDGEVDRLPDIRDRGVAFQPVDIAVIGIDRIDLAGKLILAQHRQQPARDLLQITRGADQGDAGRGKK